MLSRGNSAPWLHGRSQRHPARKLIDTTSFCRLWINWRQKQDNRHSLLKMIHLFMIQFKNMTHTSRFQGNVWKQTVNHDIIASSAGKPPTFSPLHKVKSNVQDYIRRGKGSSMPDLLLYCCYYWKFWFFEPPSIIVDGPGRLSTPWPAGANYLGLRIILESRASDLPFPIVIVRHER
jgi:hypothetical protein